MATMHLDVKATIEQQFKGKGGAEWGILLCCSKCGRHPLKTAYRNQATVYPFWPVLEEFSMDLGNQPLELEPGQALQEVLQFMVPDYVETVLIHYSFHDAGSLAEPPTGWGITEVYDIIGNAT